MSIKKAYVGIIELLEANKDKKVSSVLKEAVAMASAKTGGGASAASTVLRDAKNTVVAIFCYYHKQWEPVTGDNAVEYGKKATSATGLNNMCKEGTAAWGKQNRDAKTANAKLLSEVAAGNVKPEGIKAAQETIEKARKVVAARADKVGYNNITAAAKAMGVEAPAVS
jgi:hypothetical protein